MSASGSPGLGMRTRFTEMRRPACAYIRVTAASAWLTVDALARAASMSRFQAVTALALGLNQVGERVAVCAEFAASQAHVHASLAL